MSYDLFVFEVSKAPKTKKEFLKWYEKITKWDKDISYDDPNICSPALKNWFAEMIETFPPMDGSFPLIREEELEEIDKELDIIEEELYKNEEEPDDDYDDDIERSLTDYSIDESAIYVSFVWSIAQKAYNIARKLAIKHGVGFFDASGDEGHIILPDLSMIGATAREELEMKMDVWHDLDEYQKIVDAILAFEDKDSDLLLSLAVEYNNIKQYEEAIETLMKIKDDFGDYDHWYYVLGYAYRYMGKYEEAIENLEKALKKSGGYFGYMDILAYCYYKVGKKELAKDTIKKSIDKKIKNIKKTNNDEEYKEIIESIVNEYTIEFCDEEMINYLCEAYHKTGAYYFNNAEKEKAKKYFEEALKIRPDDTYAKDYLLKYGK